MREQFAFWLVRRANNISRQHKWKLAPKGRYDTLQRLKILIDQINHGMYQVPKRFSLWVDWTIHPQVLTLKEDSNIVYPNKSVEKFKDAKLRRIVP